MLKKIILIVFILTMSSNAFSDDLPRSRARQIRVSTTDFDTNLSSADTNAQLALDTIDDLALGGSGDITAVGDVASGLAFTGTQGTTLTFNHTSGDGILEIDTSSHDFSFNNDLDIEDTDPHLRLTPASGDSFEMYAYDSEWYFTNVTDSTVLFRVRTDNNLWVEQDLMARGNLTVTGTSTLGDLTIGSSKIIDMGANKVTNLLDPTTSTDSATKNYVDNAVSGIMLDFFYNDTASDIGGIYTNMTDNDLGGVESSILTSGLSAGTDNQALNNFATLSGHPKFETLSIGVYDCHIHAEQTSGNKPVRLYWILYTRTDPGGVENAIITSETSALVTSKAAFDIHGVLATDVELASSDRLVVKFFANVGGAGGTVDVTLYQEGVDDSHLAVSVLSDAFSDIFVRQDGTTDLTAQWDVTQTVTTTGNVGIGTTGPGEKLEVVGNIKISDDSKLTNAAGAYVQLFGGADPDVDIYAPTNGEIDLIAGVVTTSSSLTVGNSLTVTNEIEVSTSAISDPSYTFTGDGDTGMYSPSADKLGLVTGGTARLYISGGNVGIGTTGPGAALDIAKDLSGIATGKVLDLSGSTLDSGDDYWLYLSSGNYWRSDIAHIQNLQIGSSLRANNIYQKGSSALSIRNDAAYDIDVVTDSDTDFNVGSGQLFVNGNTGKVGIGTTGPRAVLDVTGSIVQSWDDNFLGTQYEAGALFKMGLTTSSTNRILYIDNKDGEVVPVPSRPSIQFRTGSTPSTAMTIQYNGNVGIGTTGPTEKLQVVGTVDATGYEANGNVGISQTETGVTDFDITIEEGLITSFTKNN